MKRWLIAAVAILGLVGAGAWIFLSRPSPPLRNDLALVLRTFALNLDPATLAETDSRKVATLLYTGLVAVDQDGTIRPRVARSWKRLDPNSWSFTLADRVTFPDGSPVTADRVIRSLCASMQPAHVQAWSLASIDREPAAKGAVKCTGLTAPDERTVVVRETKPTPWLLEALAGPGGWIVDVAAKPGQYGVRAGTGPYVVASITPDKEVVLKARAGAAVPAKVQQVTIRYMPDDAVVAARYAVGDIDLVEIETPQIRDLMLTPAGAMRNPGQLSRHQTDRVRVVGFNMKRLAERGFDPEQLRLFLDRYSGAISRSVIAGRAQGLAAPMVTGFPPSAGESEGPARLPEAVTTGPSVQLTLLTENDPFSDMVGAMLPKAVGNVGITYQAVEKSLLISALLKGDYDMALLKIEATHHTPSFWAAFFRPGDPYTVFGHPIAGIEAIDLTNDSGIRQAGKLIDKQGNWIGVFREVGIYATAPHISGVRLTPSGQLSLEEIGRSK